jgi:glycogen operon protein
MICGKYARVTKTCEDDFFYFAYNMHWEDHTFALPKLPKGFKWDIGFATCNEISSAVIHESLVKNKESVTVPDRTIAVLVSVKDNRKEETLK